MSYQLDTMPLSYEAKSVPYHITYSGSPVTEDPSQQFVGENESEITLRDVSLSWIPSRHSQLRTAPRLEKPVVIPRIGTASKLEIPFPFLRAYSHVLRAHDVHESEFLSMIDNLSIAQAASPPMKAVDVAGMVLGFVPHHWAQAASFGVRVAAGVGTAGISAARTSTFLKEVNGKYLNPRGLQVSMKKDEELVAQFRLPEDAQILGPAEFNSEPVSLKDRRMYALAPYIAPLTMDVPAPVGQHSVLDKMSAKQISRRIAKQDKDARKKLSKKNRKSKKRGDSSIKLAAKEAEQAAKLQYLVIENFQG